VTVKGTTRGLTVWGVKAGRVHLVDASGEVCKPTDQEYWLIVVRNPATGECKYFINKPYGGSTTTKRVTMRQNATSCETGVSR
jgi:hypothetical protein